MTFRAICSALLLSITLTLSFQSKAETLRIGTDSWPPFREIQQNQITGIDNDLWLALSKKMGFEIQYIQCPWKRCLDLMQSGELDAMSGLAWRKERAVYIHYVEPSYYQCSTRFYVRTGNEHRLTSEKQLRELNIGMVRGSAYYPGFDKDNSLQKTQLAQESVLLPLLATGRIDSYIGTDCQADFELANSRWSAQLVKAPFDPKNHTPLFIGFSKSSQWSKKTPEFSRAVQAVLNEGFLSQIQERYYRNLSSQ